MKRVLITLVAMLFAMLMISCGDSKNDPKTDNEVTDDTTDEVVTDDVVTDDVVTDDTTDDVLTDDDVVSCVLDTAWMTPDDAWTSWGYLKLMGEVGDYEGDYVAAVFTDGKIKLTETTTELTDGSFMNYQGSVLLADAGAYEFINVNQTAGTATVDYWDAMYQFSQALIPAMKEQMATEAGFGATVFFRHTFIDVTFDASGALTAQFTRKNCFIGLSKTEEQTDGTDTYDVPIGDMYGCFDGNIDGSVGEELKMMFKNEFTEDETAMLEFFNTRSDGTVAVYGETDYTHLCTCYAPDGTTEVNCWNEYDGPGGAEDCPAVVEAAGECDTVETDDDVIADDDVVTTDDVVTDDVVTDDVVTDDVVTDADTDTDATIL